MRQFSILVNSTDSFEDCWIPFFTQFKKYWRDFNGTIYLNTETKNFSFNGLNIVAVQNNRNNPYSKLTWSECLFRALDAIPDNIVLYMQEDYFLHDFVKNGLVNELAQLINTTDIDCIHLTDQATPGPFHQTRYEQLLETDKNAPYRISTQAALWKKDILKKYIRKHESAWQFEQYATKRACILKHVIYNVNTNIYIKDQNEIIPYVFTGIIKGKWNKEVLDLFLFNTIKPEYSKRGFYEVENKITFIKRGFNYLKKIVPILLSEIDLIRLRMHQIY